MDVVETIKKKQPQAEIYVYPDAPHAFSNDDRPSFRKEATDLAWKRTQEFLAKNMKK
jgi:carboxymethylenebutenolidase